MKPVSPVFIDKQAHEIQIGKNQPEYFPIPALVEEGEATPILSRWEPTPEERARIAAGADILLTVLTFGKPFSPISLDVIEKDLTFEGHQDRIFRALVAESLANAPAEGEPGT